MKPSPHTILGIDESQLSTPLERQLWAVVQWQSERIAVLEKRVAELERENAELRLLLAKALKNSSTSSKPPSSDIVKPPKLARRPGQRRKGGQPGHPKHDRDAFTPEQITAVHTYTSNACPHCQGQDLILLPDTMRVVQQVEVIEKPLEVNEHRGLAYLCNGCGKIHYAPLPATVEQGGLIGPILTAQIAYMKGAMHASFSTIRRYVRDTMGLRISRGHLSALLAKVTEALEQPYEDLRALLKSEEVLHVDETGHKDNGDRFWTWCFRAKAYCVFTVAGTRSSDVLLAVLGHEFEGVLGCDHFSAYRKYLRLCDVRVQFCLAHFIREIKFLTTLNNPNVVDYGNRLLKEFRVLFFALHLEDLPPAALTRALTSVREAIVAQSQRDVPDVKEAQLVAQRLRDYEDEYFEFIRTPEVEPTNNAAEQALRFVTIDRHITQGTRSEKGRHWCERIWTVLATCTLQGRSAYDYLVEAVQAHFNGKPIPALLLAPP